MAMDLLRDRDRRFPISFALPGRLILNTEFSRAIVIEYDSLQRVGNTYTIPDYMMEWVLGVWPSVGGKPWEECTHLYIPVIANLHYFAVEIIFADSTIYVYDSDHLCLTQGQLEQVLEPLAVIVPVMARRADVIVGDRLAIVRNMTTTGQSVS